MSAATSSKLLGAIDRMRARIGGDSSWNTPIESPRLSRSNTRWSSSATVSMSNDGSLAARTIATVSVMTSRLRRPRKSIFSRPSSSTPCISYWVTTGAFSGSPPASGLRCTGRYVVSGSLVMTTAAAWMPSLRLRPSRPLATSTTRLTSGSAWYMARSSVAALNPSVYFGFSSKQYLSGVSRPITSGGMALAILSPTPYGKPSTRAASRTALRALMVPNVMIWATWSRP